MGNDNWLLSYEELLNAFKKALDRALLGRLPTPVSEMQHVTLMLALLDITHAVRERRPTQQLVTRALNVFAQYAADHDEAQWLGDKNGTSVW